MSKFLVLLASLMMFSAVSFADDSSSGCGLGWMVFKKNSLVSSSLRATTNVMFLNTVAMTLGTSGCARHDIVMNEKKAIHFAQANFGKIMQEMAQGRGEFVTTFADVLGCNDVAGFTSSMQQNFSHVVGSSDGLGLYNTISQEFNTNSEFQKACGTI
jgi:predicted sugar kinase